MTIFKKFGLATALLALFIGCVQPPTAPNGEIETSDEAGNTVTTQAVPANGLKGDYYDNVDFTGTLKTRYDANVNRTWNANAPISGIQATTYSVRWTGQVMPAFSQTYTFFVTSSDGARLMVNGQVLVNDWVDGSSRVRSGTVALQANTKYDIRLEYYRNATNAGAVKLEWQSSSRGRQVVPQASLFSTGSNTVDALNVVKSTSGFPAGVDFDQLQATGTKIPNGFTIIARERNSVNFIVAALLKNSITVLYRVVNDGGQLTLTDVLTKASTSLGTVSQYVNADGTSTDAQKEALKKQFVLLLSQGVFVAGSIQSTGVVRPQVVSWICEARVLPPPACEICVDTAVRYRDTVCSSAGALSALVIGGLASIAGTPVIGGAVAFVIGAPDLPTLFSLPSIPQELSDRWSRYLACIEGRLGGSPTCKMAIAVDNVDEVKPVNSKGFVAITVRNKPAPDADASLEYGVRFKDRIGIIGISVTSGDFLRNDGGRLTPGSSRPVRVEYECPSTPTVLRLELYIDNNSNNPSGIMIGTATVRCEGGSKIFVTPNPLELVAALNSSTTGTLTISNTGTVPLEVSSIISSQPWLTASPSSLIGIDAVAPGGSRTISVTGSCGAQPMTLTPDANVSFQSTGGTENVVVKLQCRIKDSGISLIIRDPVVEVYAGANPKSLKVQANVDENIINRSVVKWEINGFTEPFFFDRTQSFANGVLTHYISWFINSIGSYSEIYPVGQKQLRIYDTMNPTKFDETRLFVVNRPQIDYKMGSLRISRVGTTSLSNGSCRHTYTYEAWAGVTRFYSRSRTPQSEKTAEGSFFADTPCNIVPYESSFGDFANSLIPSVYNKWKDLTVGEGFTTQSVSRKYVEFANPHVVVSDCRAYPMEGGPSPYFPDSTVTTFCYLVDLK